MIIVFWFEAVIFERLNELGNEECVMEIKNEKFCKNCKGNLFPPIIYHLTTNPLIFKSSQFSNSPIFKSKLSIFHLHEQGTQKHNRN